MYALAGEFGEVSGTVSCCPLRVVFVRPETNRTAMSPGDGRGEWAAAVGGAGSVVEFEPPPLPHEAARNRVAQIPAILTICMRPDTTRRTQWDGVTVPAGRRAFRAQASSSHAARLIA
ncbi:hypothetical protein FAIPA1_150043 [Frankia sp. AiPs1]